MINYTFYPKSPVSFAIHMLLLKLTGMELLASKFKGHVAFESDLLKPFQNFF